MCILQILIINKSAQAFDNSSPGSTIQLCNRLYEEERILGSGGFVVRDTCVVLRVDGVLAMTRAIGDRSMKPYVGVVPEVTCTTRTDEDECLIIASDGFVGSMNIEEVGSVAFNLLQHKRGCNKICCKISLSTSVYEILKGMLQFGTILGKF
ncbi:putative protein phosphatase 2C 68 [Bidens hawaiensis]|uniref:putative protein phosphatase 2C 68 n=1 Tax=Bidens hawaiensis TaxID=980011 RepID=UPI00404AD258